MYLEIDEGYFEHPKTLDLCARLEDHQALAYPLRLWKWACRSAKTGELGKISGYAIEKVVEYKPMDGKCFEALCEVRFIDRGEDGSCQIHNWMERTGGSLKRMEEKAAANKRRRDEARIRHEEESSRARTGIVPESREHRTDTNPTKTRQDQTRPDKSEESPPASARDPRLLDGSTDNGAKTAHDWLTYFNARFFAAKGRQRGCSSDAKATANLADLLAALPDTERAEDWDARERIVDEFLARTDQRTAEAGWKFAFFVASFDGLRLPPDKRPTVRDGPGKSGGSGKPYYDPNWRQKANG